MDIRRYCNRVMDYFTVYKVYWNRGYAYAQLVFGLANLITFMIVSNLNKFFPSGSYYIILLLVGLLLGPVLLGSLDYHYGTGKRENVYYYELNPVANDSYKTVKKMAEDIRLLREEIASLRGERS